MTSSAASGGESSSKQGLSPLGTSTAEAYAMYGPTRSGSMTSAISSTESSDGPWPSSRLDGGTGPCGQAPAPASPSARQGGRRGSRMKGTSGQLSSASSRSAALRSLLESRLRQRLEGAGSTLYSETWRRKATPAGRPYLAHTASAAPTSGSGYTGGATGISGYPTPQARDYKGPQGRAYETKRATSSTTSRVVGKKKKQALDLPAVALMVEGVGQRFPGARVSGKAGNGFCSVTARGVQLNPALSRWLMGFPREWDDCVAMVTLSASRPPRRS